MKCETLLFNFSLKKYSDTIWKYYYLVCYVNWLSTFSAQSLVLLKLYQQNIVLALQLRCVNSAIDGYWPAECVVISAEIYDVWVDHGPWMECCMWGNYNGQQWEVCRPQIWAISPPPRPSLSSPYSCYLHRPVRFRCKDLDEGKYLLRHNNKNIR